MSIDSGIALLIALAGALLLGAAAAHKLRAFSIFEATFAEYRLFPQWQPTRALGEQASGARRGTARSGLAAVVTLVPLVRLAAILVVMLECAVTLGLLVAETRAFAAIAGAALLVAYAVAIGINLLRGRRDLDCGCTLQHRPIGGWMIVRNVILGALLLLPALPVSNRTLGVPDIATILATLLVAALLYMAADLLLGRTQSRQGYSMDAP